jgi:hypothetical protein
LLGQWESEPAEALGRLQIMRDLVGFEVMLKQPSDLLADAIRAYAAGTAAPPLTLPARDRDALAAYLDRIMAGDAGLAAEVAGIVGTVRSMKDQSRAWMAEARAKALAEMKWESIPVEERRALTFKDFFASGAEHWAEALAEPLGVAEACRRNGLDGLLRVRAVRMCVGAMLSLVFAQVVGDGVQSRKPRRGDGYDVWHGVLASAADIFVTGDKALADQLDRVPVENFRVARSLRALLDDPAQARSR